MDKVRIGNKNVGFGESVFVIAEVGINHNGDVGLAKRLIDAAIFAGADAVKFQKRDIETVYSAEELSKYREIPAKILKRAAKRGVLSPDSVNRLKESNFSDSINGDLKLALEFNLDEYSEIDRYCRESGILWFVSCWDEESVDFIEKFNPPCYKIASASLTDDNLLRYTRLKGKPIILSTGMSTIEEIDHAVDVLGLNDLILLHAVSTYPANNKDLNLLVVPELMRRYQLPIGYSGHEVCLSPSIMATVLGACMIERHLTLDRSIWGSDHAASVEPADLRNLIRDIRIWKVAKGNGKKVLLEAEIPVRDKLRRK